MNLTTFLQELRRVGITLVREGESLRVQGPKGALTPDLRGALTAHKQAILAYLQDASGGDGAELVQCEPNPAALYEPFPLSDLQLGFFMADDPYMEFHVRPHYYMEKDRVDLDVERYEAAWNKALARHRHELVIVRSEGDLVTVREPSPLRVRVYDLREQPASEVARVLHDVRQQMMRAELPIDTWPWVDLRVSLWREAGVQRARTHYNHNNFFSDGYGTAKLLQEIELYYRDPRATLPPIELSYRDAVVTLDRLERSPQGAVARRYWEDRLPHLPGPPELPTKAGMDRRCRSRLNRREGFFDAATWSGFKANARHFGLTPSNAVFAVYAEILAAWSNNPRFVVSNMMTRRLAIHPHINEIIGNFASLYPLEIDATGGTLAERALRVQERVLRDSEHRAWGGMQVMQALNRQQGGLGRAPVPFVVGSGLFMEGFGRSDFSCLETSQVMFDHQFWDQADGRCYYVWDLLEEFFPEGMIDAMNEAYEDLVGRLARDHAPWGAEVLDVIPARQLEARRAVAAPERPVADLRLEERLGEVAARHPDDLVLSMPGSTLTYRELAERSDRLASALVQAGVERGQTVAVVAHRGPAMLEAVYAIAKAGAAYVPIPPSLPDERRAYVLENSGARHVIAEPALAQRLAWPSAVTVLTPGTSAEHPEPAPRARGELTDLAYVIYTSGSTGRPKGVMIDHRGAVNTILDVNERFGVGRGDRIFGVSSFGFDLSVYDIFGTTASGATLVYPDPEQTLNPAHWLDLLGSERVTVWNSAPPLAALLVEAAELRGARLPELRLVMLSGDWIPVDLPDRIRAIAPGAKVVSLGGATEASIWSIVYEIGEVDPSWASIPYGYPMVNQSWHVLDEWGRPAPEWTPGELYIGGIGLALGYMNDPEQTAKGFVAHPVTGERLYRTGDIGRYLPGGVIEFLGRRDSQVKIQGHRIELGEIETVLAACPGVGSAVAAVHRPAGGSPRLVAYVVPEPGATLDDDELRAQLGRKLPDYMVPRTFERLERLPLSSNGKVDRKALPAVGQDDRATDLRVEPAREPLDAIEVELLAIWARVLKCERVGVNDDFFDLGGHSFEAVRIVGLVRELLGASLSLGDIWQGRTVARLAERIRAGRDEPLGCLVAVKPDGVGTPLLLVHPAGGHVLCYRELAARLACPVLAFQAPGLDGRAPALESIPELSRVYIDQLDALGPEGAVIVGGWSSGGLIAHEMAVQLRARGRAVEGVVIIDSPAPLVHRPIADDVLFEWFLGDLSLEPSLQASVQALDRTGLTERQQLEQAAEVMRQHDADLGADVEQLAAIYQVFKGIVRGSREHHAHAVDADLLVLRAEQGVVQEFEHHPFGDDADWGWRKLTRGAIATGAVDATHYTLLRTPAVDAVASLVERWISRTRASAHAAPMA